MESQPAQISFSQSAISEEGTETPVVLQQVVASKNGTKYHLPWCPGAKQIKDENKITFISAEEARVQGYTPAANCPEL